MPVAPYVKIYLLAGGIPAVRSALYFGPKPNEELTEHFAGSPASFQNFVARPGTRIDCGNLIDRVNLVVIDEECGVTPDSVTSLFRVLEPKGRIICPTRLAEPFCSNGQINFIGTITEKKYCPDQTSGCKDTPPNCFYVFERK